MKLSIKKYEGYANTPTFAIDYGNLEFDDSMVIPLGNPRDDAWYLAFNYDLSVMDYRLLCRMRRDGNVNYGHRPRGYESGWASRASCINKQLGYQYVDVSNYGIELDKLLYLIQDKYVGDVFIAIRETNIDVEYMVEPYFKDQHDSYCTECDHLILHTVEPGFIEIALHHLTGVDDLYVWPNGDTYEGSNPPHWRSDDYTHYSKDDVRAVFALPVMSVPYGK